VIDTYGSPRQVAEKYTEEDQIIATAFKGHLIRYTAILFAFHFGLILVAIIFKIDSMIVLPFFYFPEFDSFQSFFYLPMAFVYDLGLVGIILYFVTQSRKEIKLPWPRLKLNWQKMASGRTEKSKPLPMILMLLGYAALVYVYLRYRTLFFKSLDPGSVESLFSPEASRWYSLAFLCLLGVGFLAYIIKFFIQTEGVNLLRSAFQLVIIGIVINRPLENPIREFFYFDIQLIADLILALAAILLTVDFLKSLIILGKRALSKNTESY
jgi:hypothetical protein